MNATPLKEIHSISGAEFGEYSGWTMPASYGNAAEEYRTVRARAGITDLSHRGKLRISGRDRVKFLQGMLSNDVENLEVWRCVYCTMLTVKGRMITDMKVLKEADSFLIDLEPGMNAKIKELLEKYRLSYKADIDDVTQELALISINGPGSGRIVEKAFGEQAGELVENGFVETRLDDITVTVARTSRTGELGFDLYVPAGNAPEVWESVFGIGKERGLAPVGLEAIEVLRVEAGIPLYGVDMTENTIPIEAGLDRAISYEKGCYVGQEVVARIHYRGHVNWHLVGFEVDGDGLPPAGTKLVHGEKEIGRITSAAYSPALEGVIALGYIRRELREPGTVVRLSEGSGDRAAKVVKTPFVANR
ncbi:MAG: aminomethyl transferase family protein [Candidatus Dadabacteria bacterium]|nr:aminomethyl transferase family protein [Candidatus Dadabacteria bacterium]